MDITENIETVKKNKRVPKRNRKTILLILFIILTIAFLIGNHYASKTLQTKGYTGTWDFAKTVISNYWNGRDANPEKISIEIKDKDFKFLERNREHALERNVIINNIDGDYVPATLEYKGKKMKVKLRLKGHMTDHLQDNKWSFRIKIKSNDSFMGMRRFSIQHPGTRGYLYEWIYHELMKQEGIIALRYKFIDVTLNGRNWGIYAVEENFDKELIENNNRVNGPIVRFNPDLYWVDRYNEILHEKRAAEFASYYSSYIQPYSEDAVLADSLQRNYFLKAMALMEGIRTKKLSVQDVFDIPRLAKFHAIIDLVGGEHSIDWSDLKYYYNPVTAKLEPVAYESFTDFPLREISGTYRYVQLDSSKENYEEWHTALFSNTEFFKTYVAQLERISKTSYLDNFFSSNNKELMENLKILNKEFPYKKFEKQGYYRNQEMIKKILSPPQAFNAYFTKVADGKLFLKIGSIESLPSEIKSVSIGKNIICRATNEIILPSKQGNHSVKYKDYSFTTPSGFVWNDSLINTLNVNYSILGSSKTFETKVFPHPHTDAEFISDDLKNKKGNINDFSFLLIDENNKTIFLKKGKQIITSDLVIPAGYNVIASGDISIDLKNHSKIISYSPLHFSGNEDEPITIESSDSSGQGIEVINASKSKLQNVTFKNFAKVNDNEWKRAGAITFYESPIEFKNCIFMNCKAEDAVNIIRSDFSFNECLFRKTNNAIAIDFSEGTIISTEFGSWNNDAIDLTMSNVTVKSIVVNDVRNNAFNIHCCSELKGDDIRIYNSNIAIAAEGLSSVILKTFSLHQVKQSYLKGKGTLIFVNGKRVGNEINDAEKIIKNDKKK